MTDYLIEKLVEIRFSKDDIDAIGTKDFAFLSITLFAANEIFVFYKYMASNIYKKDLVEPQIQALATIQQAVILRIMSAKLFEFIELYEAQHKKWMRSGASAEMDRFADRTKELSEIKSGQFYDLTKRMRNKITNHYAVDDIVGNINYIDSLANLTAQMHEEQGNSFFPIGEEVVFIGLMNKYMSKESGLTTFEEKRSFTENWIAWTLKAARWVSATTYDIIRYYVIERLQKKGRVKTFHLDPKLIADVTSHRAPIMLRSNRNRWVWNKE